MNRSEPAGDPARANRAAQASRPARAGAVPPIPLSARDRSSRAAAAVALATLLALAAVLPVARPLPIDVCLFKRATGLPCIACGMTRSVCAVAKGEWGASLAHHPAGWLAALGALGGAIWLGTEALSGRALRPRLRRRLAAALIAAFLGVALVAWIARLLALPRSVL